MTHPSVRKPRAALHRCERRQTVMSSPVWRRSTCSLSNGPRYPSITSAAPPGPSAHSRCAAAPVRQTCRRVARQPSWTAKAEYLHFDLGRQNFDFTTPVGSGFTFTVDENRFTIDTVRTLAHALAHRLYARGVAARPRRPPVARGAIASACHTCCFPDNSSARTRKRQTRGPFG
jgi:hypothetical protein